MRTLTIALLLAAAPAAAQDTLRLPALQDAAVQRDPRARQAALQAEATRLRIRNLETERLPQFGVRGEATRQSEVATIPISLPSGTPPSPPKNRYEAGVDGQLVVYDGGVNAQRRAAERAQLAVSQAQLAATLYPVRAEVNEAFFAAFLLQERLRESATTVDDLEARLRFIRAQVRNGAALPGDTAAILAALLRTEEDRAQLAADRRAALDVLARLTGRGVSTRDVLALPGLEGAVRAAAADSAQRTHPQFGVFAAQRARLDRDAALADARARPQLAVFGQLNYGSPGFSQFNEDPHDYWIAGVRLRWAPWDWGNARRDREAIHVQQQSVETEQAAFAERLRRQVSDEVETMARLEGTLATDERIIALRAQVERQASAQFAERAITADQYVDARTKLEEARVTRDRHRVELARAQASYLTTFGMELP